MTRTTTDLYWDCDCKEDYIHRSSQKFCQKCNANRDDWPSSRRDEVLAKFNLTEGELEEKEEQHEIFIRNQHRKIEYLAIAVEALRIQRKALMYANNHLPVGATDPYSDHLGEAIKYFSDLKDEFTDAL